MLIDKENIGSQLCQDKSADTMTYEELKFFLIKKIGFSENNIYDYELSPYSEEFKNTYLFYRDNLVSISEKFKVDNSFFFFQNVRSVNARAIRRDDFYLIAMNAGLLINQIQKFKEYDDLIQNKELESYVGLENEMDVYLNDLLYQGSIHFTFYHEFAHLIQFSRVEYLRPKKEIKLHENPVGEDDFSILKHLLELDADEFSAINIGSHLIQHIDTIYGDNFTQERIEQMLIIACSSSFLYMMMFQSNYGNLYLKESSHPHPTIRILAVVMTIVNYVQNSLTKKKPELKISSNDIVNRTVSFSEIVGRKILENAPITEFKKTLQEKGDVIMKYYNEFDILKKQTNGLAVHTWNEYANSLNSLNPLE